MVLCSEPWEDVRFKIGDLKSERNSDATALARAAAVVRHRGDVDDGGDLKTDGLEAADGGVAAEAGAADADLDFFEAVGHGVAGGVLRQDRKSTRLNSSHQIISYAVFCLKKKKNDSQSSIST